MSYLDDRGNDPLPKSLQQEKPVHTVDGKTSEDGWPYGTTHDYDCPGCVDTPFLASPRSETYWSS